jgi:hypothetical protein
MPSAPSAVEIETLGMETGGRPETVTVTVGVLGGSGGAGASLTGGAGGGVGGVGKLVVGGGPMGVAATGPRGLVVPAVGAFGVLALGFLDTGLPRGVRTGMWVWPCSGCASRMFAFAVCLVSRRAPYVVGVVEMASRWGCVTAVWRSV